jgi:transcriptional regulator with XRE-family HTH domain
MHSKRKAHTTCDSRRRAANSARRQLHRLKTVCRLEGVSKHTLARQLNCSVATVSRQIEPDSDILLSDLYKWSRALEVPAAELVGESDDEIPAAGVRRRAQLLRVMKTAVSIREACCEPEVWSSVENIIEQLIGIMPQLEDVSAWRQIGQRRRLDEYGVTADRVLPLDVVHALTEIRRSA